MTRPRYQHGWITCSVSVYFRFLMIYLIFFFYPTKPGLASLVPRLEGPAINPGQGYDPKSGVWRSKCLTGQLVYGGQSSSFFSINKQVSKEALRSYMSSSLTGTANLFIASAKASVKYSRSVAEDHYAMTLTYMYDLRGKHLILDHLQLTDEGIRARNTRDPEFIKILCGEQFVRKVSLGGTLFLNAHYQFTNKEVYDEFKAKIQFKVMGFKVTKHWKHNSRYLNRNSKVSFDGWQIGGNPDTLNQLLTNARQKVCTLDQLQNCEKIVDDLLNYATSPRGFISQLADLSWREHGAYPALAYELSDFSEAGFPELNPIPSDAIDGATETILEDIAFEFSKNSDDHDRAKLLLESQRLISPDLENVRAIFEQTAQNKANLLKLKDTCMKQPSGCHLSWQQLNLLPYVRSQLVIPEKLYHYCLDTELENSDDEFSRLFKELFSSGMFSDCLDLNHNPDKIRSLNLSNARMSSVAPLKFFSEIRNINLSYNQISVIRALSHLKKLETLNLRDNQISSLYPLKYLNQLRNLNLAYNEIKDANPIKKPGLKYLYLHGNPLTSVTWFAERSDQYEELTLNEFDLCKRERRRALQKGWIDQDLFEIYEEAEFGPYYPPKSIVESQPFFKTDNEPTSWLYCPLVARTYPH